MVTNKWIPGFEDISDALKIRESVFIKEQNGEVSFEQDGLDGTSLHLVIYEDEIPVGCGRIIIKGDYYKLSKIAVLKDFRNRHYGDLILRLLLFKAFSLGISEVRLDAQLGAVSFYERFGFVSNGDVFSKSGFKNLPMKVTQDTVRYPSSCNDSH